MRHRGRWAWRRWRSPSSIGPGRCPASSGASRVIGLQPCSPMAPQRRARMARGAPAKARNVNEITPSTDAQQRQVSRVVIIGTGLIGASIGCALSAAGYAHLRDHKISHARSPLAWAPAQSILPCPSTWPWSW